VSVWIVPREVQNAISNKTPRYKTPSHEHRIDKVFLIRMDNSLLLRISTARQRIKRKRFASSPTLWKMLKNCA
jgi:hypothetical protein